MQQDAPLMPILFSLTDQYGKKSVPDNRKEVLTYVPGRPERAKGYQHELSEL